jgi:hypothetical protein
MSWFFSLFKSLITSFSFSKSTNSSFVPISVIFESFLRPREVKVAFEFQNNIFLLTNSSWLFRFFIPKNFCLFFGTPRRNSIKSLKLENVQFGSNSNG